MAAQVVFTTEAKELTQHLLVVPARDRNSPDKLTLTLEGPMTADRARLIRVLQHLLSDDAEWDSQRPNVSFIVQHVS